MRTEKALKGTPSRIESGPLNFRIRRVAGGMHGGMMFRETWQLWRVIGTREELYCNRYSQADIDATLASYRRHGWEVNLI